ncbi:hypothetical protein AVEN_172590-1 [Araneus ventricosus]|uniref:Uncharacterized protein n=1 Tax=Araneus ventricosus TaxID=182803 RepID=A0A4Y2QZY1_ARAVE|nr:hypothetical protein AVEN_55196-1 [Araneus ventricosus]GBN68780.1 hypothetical protein AVEN_172590-1 [Araneus ventricosus]
MTRTTPELAPPSPNFHATPTGGRLATTFDLACNRPHTRRIFSGIGFRAFDPPVPRQNGFIASIRLKQTFLLNLNAKSIPINNTSRSWSTDSTSTGSTTIHVSSLNSDDTSASEGGIKSEDYSKNRMNEPQFFHQQVSHVLFTFCWYCGSSNCVFLFMGWGDGTMPPGLRFRDSKYRPRIRRAFHLPSTTGPESNQLGLLAPGSRQSAAPSSTDIFQQVTWAW